MDYDDRHLYQQSNLPMDWVLLRTEMERRMFEALESIIGGVVSLFAVMFLVTGMSKLFMPIAENDAQNGVFSIILSIVIAVPIYMYFIN